MHYESLDAVPQQPVRYLVRVPITTDMNGMQVALTVHVLVGQRPGPTLTLLSGLHGNEWGHLHFFKEFVETCDVQQLAGRVLVVPMANAVAFGTLSRVVRDDSDNPDSNRVFPYSGPQQTWLSEQVALAVARNVVDVADCLIDYHLGMWGSVLGSSIVGIDYSRPEVNQRCQELSMLYGVPLIYGTRAMGAFPGPRSSASYACEVRGIPAFGSMLGGMGFDQVLEQEWAATNLRGIYNVMKGLGMLEGAPELPERYLIYERVQRVNPRVGGLLLPSNTTETFGRLVQAGELLGRVVSPFTFEVLEELRAPFEGYLAYWARSYPLRPGDWAYAVIPIDHPGTRWVQYPHWQAQA